MTIKHTQDLAQIRAMVPEMRRVKCIHFVGIGGAGMSGIAEVRKDVGKIKYSPCDMMQRCKLNRNVFQP